MADNKAPIVFGKELIKSRVSKARQRKMAHTDNGFPHYQRNTGHCMCLDTCCFDEREGGKGCICKYCPCQLGLEHPGSKSPVVPVKDQVLSGQVQN